MKAITSVKVNDTVYENGYVYVNSKYMVSSSTDGLLSLGGASFTDGENIVVITATKYPDLTITIKDGELVSAVASAE